MGSYLAEYCEAVLSGQIVACQKIKQVCERLRTRMNNPAQYHFDLAKAQRPIEFIEKYCRCPAGKIGVPMVLQLPQKAWIEAAFGFVDDDGVRQIREVLIVCGRKNGKTSLLSALALYLLLADGEGAPQIVTASTMLDQSKLSWNAAYRMVKQSPLLSKHIRKRTADLYFEKNLGTFRALASNENSLDGLDIHGAILDELAAWKSRGVYDLIVQAISARRQPQIWEITTNNFIRDGIFDDHYNYCADVLSGEINDERILPFIYELDSLDEINDEQMWIKANPMLGTVKSAEYLRGMVKRAKNDPSIMPTVMVKDFDMKQTAESAWLRYEDFNNDETFDIRDFKYCIGGFDAADTTDLNAAKAVFVRDGDPNLYVKSMYWIPEDVLQIADNSQRERDNVPYRKWVERGLMRTVAGNRVPKSIFLDWFKELREEYGIYTRYIGFDPWHVDEDMLQKFRREFGANSMIPVRQGAATLSQPMKDLKPELQAGRVIYGGNPIDKMCFMNTAIKTDINANIQPVKDGGPEHRIDGTVALLCAWVALQQNRTALEVANTRRKR